MCARVREGNWVLSRFGLTMCLPATLSCMGQFNWNGNRENVAAVSANTPPRHATRYHHKFSESKSVDWLKMRCTRWSIVNPFNYFVKWTLSRTNKLHPCHNDQHPNATIYSGIFFFSCLKLNKQTSFVFFDLVFGEVLNHGVCPTNCWICFTIVDIIKWLCE